MTTLSEKLQQGIEAAEAGQTTRARVLLSEVVEADETQVEAWFWLSQVVHSLEEKALCLENVLTLDPDYEPAHAELDWVRSEQERLFKPVYAPGDEAPPPGVVILPPEVRPRVTIDYPHQEELDNKWLCPYCLDPTEPQHRACPACQRPLTIRKRVREERTAWLWRGFYFQLAVAVGLLALGAGGATIVLKFSGVPSFVPYLPLYFGQPVDRPAETIQTVLELFPPWAFWGLIGLALVQLGLMALLHFRVYHGNSIYMVHASLMLAAGITGFLFFNDSYLTISTAGLTLLLGAAQLFITLNLWSDFTFKEGRLQLRIDPGAETHAALYMSGRKYTRLEMWGKAALHLRRAIAKEPQRALYHFNLAIAYLNLKKYSLADQALQHAEQLDPTAAEIEQLRQRLDTLTGK